MQSMQSSDDELAWTVEYLPVPQPMQSLGWSLPWTSTHLPAAQPIQASAPGPAAELAVEYLPAAQSPEHELEDEPPAPYLPASQVGQSSGPGPAAELAVE